LKNLAGEHNVQSIKINKFECKIYLEKQEEIIDKAMAFVMDEFDGALKFEKTPVIVFKTQGKTKNDVLKLIKFFEKFFICSSASVPDTAPHFRSVAYDRLSLPSNSRSTPRPRASSLVSSIAAQGLPLPVHTIAYPTCAMASQYIALPKRFSSLSCQISSALCRSYSSLCQISAALVRDLLHLALSPLALAFTASPNHF
jgi:hypothetical protein